MVRTKTLKLNFRLRFEVSVCVSVCARSCSCACKCFRSDWIAHIRLNTSTGTGHALLFIIYCMVRLCMAMCSTHRNEEKKYLEFK